MRYYFAALLAIILLGAPWITLTYPQEVGDFVRTIDRTVGDTASQLAAVIMHNPRTVAELQDKYNTSTSTPLVRILIVPGHEPDYGGAEFGYLKERDMALELGQDLKNLLEKDPHFQVFITRGGDSWNPEFSSYFQNHWSEIIDWQKASHKDMNHMIEVGSTTRPVMGIIHNFAPTNVALRLYGITKWANENSIDIVVHIHLNDYADHVDGVVGKHTGFAIYVPTVQYGNSTTTRVVADTVFKRLSKYNPVSDLPGESTGIVNESELIAIGANNTSDAASMLIEYGYIYESQFLNQSTRSAALSDLAYQTYLGLEDFFASSTAVALARPYDTIILPYEWKKQISASASTPSPVGPDIFALQTAMMVDGVYPPSNSNLSNCPRSGRLGFCTKEALNNFQKKYGIKGETDTIGPNTLKVLNDQFGLSTI